MIDWERYRKIYREMSLVERFLLKQMFAEYMDGNDCYADISDIEFTRLREGFIAGWICVSTMMKITEVDI